MGRIIDIYKVTGDPTRFRFGLSLVQKLSYFLSRPRSLEFPWNLMREASALSPIDQAFVNGKEIIMDVKELKAHVRALATLPETDANVLSCYLDLTDGPEAARMALLEQLRKLDRGLNPEERKQIKSMQAKILSELQDHESEIRGMAVFARGGEIPEMRVLRFSVTE